MINLTIIIPHFNTVKTLETLLDSIPEKDDVQIIVVDDKSDQHPRQYLSAEKLNRITLLDNNGLIKRCWCC